MKKAVKAKWVAALEGGEYKQGRGALCEGDRYCCLGVLACVADPEGWYVDDYGRRVHRGKYGLPGDELLRKTGLTFDEANTLASMNDGDCRPKRTFKTVAKYIRENL
jgi:hypothetical protein